MTNPTEKNIKKYSLDDRIPISEIFIDNPYSQYFIKAKYFQNL